MKASNVAAAIGGCSRVLTYISSDEDHELSPLDEPYSPDDIEIQEAILRSLNSCRAAVTTSAFASASPPATSAFTTSAFALASSPATSAFTTSAFASASSPATSAFTTSAFASVSSPAINAFTALETGPDRKGKRKLSPEGNPNNIKKSKPSRREHFNCPICFEKVQVAEKFLVSHCGHAFCNTCVGRYVAAKIAENVAMIGCPDPECKEGSVEIDLCWGVIPLELFDRWSIALCEDVVGGDKFYCPFKDCSALLINDDMKIRESECPHCHRLFCASCRVPWHVGIKCEEFKKLGDDEKGQDDLRLKNLANKKKWQRCPKCNMYVSRKSGCLLIKCRCKQYFCYKCGAPMDKALHYCNNCGH